MDVKERQQQEQWAFGCFIIASGLILFFNLWGKSLENHGYIRYAEIAREMIRSGDWIIPRWNGEIYIEKPPLLFWLIAIPSSLYGSVTPLIARLPSALSAWIGVLILYQWARRIYGTTQSGFIAGGVLLSSYQYFFQSRLAKTDILLCLFILLSFYLFSLGYGAFGRRRSLFYGLSFFSIGLGTLTKGPFGLFMPLLVIFIFLIKERQWKIWGSREFIIGYFILGVTVLPWTFLFIHHVGLEETILLFRETHILTRTAPIYFYVIEIWGQFFPWSLFLPFLLIHLWRRKEDLLKSEESFLLIWFIVLFITLTLFKYRVSRYLLPALPPLALMISGMGRMKFSLFLIPFLVVILTWHSIEFNWFRKNLVYSPGMVLTKELRPFLKDDPLYGYRLDVSTIEEINFYLDPAIPIPIIKGTENLSDRLKKERRRRILMPKEIYDEVQIREDPSIIFIREFHYKKERLILVSDQSKTTH